MTKSKLEAVVTMLAELTKEWNKSARERLSTNQTYKVALVIHEGGYGTLEKRYMGALVDRSSFNDAAELAEILEHNEGVGFDEDLIPGKGD